MHFDPRTQDALRAVGLGTDEHEEASELVAEAVREDAETLGATVHDRVRFAREADALR